MAKFIELHDHCGDPILINIEAISNVYIDGEENCYIVYLNGDNDNSEEVQENYKTVKKMILDALHEDKVRKPVNIE